MISNSSRQNGLDASVLDNKDFYHLYIGGRAYFVSVIFMTAKVIILSCAHKVREKERG